MRPLRSTLLSALMLCCAALPAAYAADPQPAAPAPAQIEANPADVASADAIMAALYDVISGPVGKPRDWNRFRSLFAPGARMIPSGKRPDGSTGFRVQTPEDYIERNAKGLVENGFIERELSRKTDQFGPLMHVFTTYEAMQKGETKPFMRGINSVQLMNDGKRWWILTVAWSAETPAQPIPAEYLKR